MKTPVQVFNNSQSLLHELYVQTQKLTKLQKILLKYLPEPVFISSYSEGVLHLFTAQSALATRIRYDERNLLVQLGSNPSFSGLQQIKVSVRPGRAPSKTVEFIHPPISEENARLIVSSAEYIEDDSLKEALINLANHTK